MLGNLTIEEVNRKLLHIVAVLLPLTIFYGPLLVEVPRSYACYLIFSLLVVSLWVEYCRLNQSLFAGWFNQLFGSMMRAEEKRQLTGATYILGGSAICSLISLPSELSAVTSFLCLSLFILGDAVAALVGKAVGRIKVGNKTLEGAVGCFMLCVFLTGLVFPQLPYFLDLWGGSITISEIVIIAATISILEFFPIKLGRFVFNDNLYVPAVATFITIWVHSGLVFN